MSKVKDPTPKSLKSFVVYKFVCQAANACSHLSTRIKKHLETDKGTHFCLPC